MPVKNQDSNPLTTTYQKINLGGISQFTVSNDGDPATPDNYVIEWSLNGDSPDGILYDGEVDIIQPKDGIVYREVYIRGTVGGEKYRIMGPPI